jgi:hypothetical protein
VLHAHLSHPPSFDHYNINMSSLYSHVLFCLLSFLRAVFIRYFKYECAVPFVVKAGKHCLISQQRLELKTFLLQSKSIYFISPCYGSRS